MLPTHLVREISSLFSRNDRELKMNDTSLCAHVSSIRQVFAVCKLDDEYLQPDSAGLGFDVGQSKRL